MKENKYKIWSIISLSLILCLSNASRATIIEYPLDCAGTYGFNVLWETDFYLGVEFIEIDSVSIEWSGEFNAGKGVRYSAPNDPFPVDVGIWANLGSNPTTRFADISGGRQTYPNPEPFDTTSLVGLHFNSTWSDLLDGQGHVKIYYTEPMIWDGYMVESGTVLLNDAKILVDGTLVPEPSSIIFLALGSLGILGFRSKALRKI